MSKLIILFFVSHIKTFKIVHIKKIKFSACVPICFVNGYLTCTLLYIVGQKLMVLLYVVVFFFVVVGVIKL